MSRIGKEPVIIPESITVDIQPDLVTVKGPKGELQINVHQAIKVEQTDHQIDVTRSSDSKMHRSIHGTTRMLIANAIHGVSEGFSSILSHFGRFRTIWKNRFLLFFDNGTSAVLGFWKTYRRLCPKKTDNSKMTGIGSNLDNFSPNASIDSKSLPE